MFVKICGLTEPAGLAAARAAGADALGFVFFAASPRAVPPARVAELAPQPGPLRVGLFVDAPEAEIAAVLAAAPLDALQLHGSEPPAACAALRARFGLPVIKAIGVAARADLARLAPYAEVVDRFLLDAAPPPGATRPGGNAEAFDWSLLRGAAIPRPWLLAGGLTPENVAAAIAATGAPGVDVSSGVERAKGVKDPARVTAFCAAARGV
jgi:phosphoribosylanthranilate isomerase